MEQNSNSKCDQMKEDRINAIRGSALRLFALYGYDQVRIQQIADECGCSHGLLYHYYSSKEDIFHDLMEYHRSKIGSFHLFIKDKKVSPYEQLNHFCDGVVRLLAGDEEEFYYFVMFTTFEFQKTLPPPPDLTDKFKKPTSLQEILQHLIKEGQKEGNICDGDPFEIAEVMYSCIRGLIYERVRNFNNNYKVPDARIIKRLVLKDI